MSHRPGLPCLAQNPHLLHVMGGTAVNAVDSLGVIRGLEAEDLHCKVTGLSIVQAPGDQV